MRTERKGEAIRIRRTDDVQRSIRQQLNVYSFPFGSCLPPVRQTIGP